jgi:hypothetical protein
MNERSANADPLATDLVERYLLGRLSESELEAFEELLLLDPEAAAAVEDAERLRRGLREVAAEDAQAAEPPPAKVVPFKRPGWRRWALPLAAAAILGVAVAPRLFGPGEGSPAREISLAQLRGGEGPLLTLGDPAERLRFSLEMNTDLPGPYRVILRRGEQVLLVQEGIVRVAGRPVWVEITAGQLEPGELEFRVETMDTPPRPAGRLQLVVEPAARPPPGR